MMSDDASRKSETRACLQRSLLGQIYPAIRAVAFRLKGGHITLRVYLDRPPNEDDFENAREVTTQALAFLNLTKTTEECVLAEGPIGRLEPMDGFVYARRDVWD